MAQLVFGTALKPGRSRVRFPMVSLEFFIDVILPVTVWPCSFCDILFEDLVHAAGGAVGFWHRVTTRKVAGSIPDGIIGIFH